MLFQDAVFYVVETPLAMTIRKTCKSLGMTFTSHHLNRLTMILSIRMTLSCELMAGKWTMNQDVFFDKMADFHPVMLCC